MNGTRPTIACAHVAASNPTPVRLVRRAAVNRALGLSRCTSYRLFPQESVRGYLLFAYVRDRMAQHAVNGARIDLGFLADGDWLDVEAAAAETGLGRARLHRLLARRVPHVRLSGKTVLVRRSDLLASLI